MSEEFGSVKKYFFDRPFFRPKKSKNRVEKKSSQLFFSRVEKNIFSKRDFIQIDVHAFWMELGRWEFQIGATGRGSGNEAD